MYTLVLASAAGRVVRSRATEKAGRSLWIDHGQGTRGFYSHLAVALALEGEWVIRGQIVGLVGRTGSVTTRPHLHFGFKFTREWIDPARMLGALPG
jgi:murein DD-endopeptidase MepM/ murein hydrolase activator NlpD